MTWKGSDGQVGNSSTCAMGYILHRQSYLWAEEEPEQAKGLVTGALFFFFSPCLALRSFRASLKCHN